VGAQANGDICQTLPFGQRLAEQGYRVALFDWSGMSTAYSRDLVAATEELRAAGATEIVVGGFSRGALVALGAAASLGRGITGVFAVSGGPSPGEGFGSIRSLSTFPGPVLLIAARQDPVFPHGTNQRIAAAHRPRGASTVVTVPGGAHALALLEESRPAVERAIDGFLPDRLGAHRRTSS
jgi:pimeloyl-ACP methyl ester carboxylesterase